MFPYTIYPKKNCVAGGFGCNKPIDGFKDAISVKEFKISGLCQTCQDTVFADPDEFPPNPTHGQTWVDPRGDTHWYDGRSRDWYQDDREPEWMRLGLPEHPSHGQEALSEIDGAVYKFNNHLSAWVEVSEDDPAREEGNG